MASNITLSAGVRQNLLSLQNTADLMSTTQNRLATGKKVNSALDNPTNFFTSSSLQSRSNDLSALLDSMSNGVKTLEAADNGLTAISKNLESMQSTLRQARQDKSFQTQSYDVTDATEITVSGGQLDGSSVIKLQNSRPGSAATLATSDVYAGPTVAEADEVAAGAGARTIVALANVDDLESATISVDGIEIELTAGASTVADAATEIDAALDDDLYTVSVGTGADANKIIIENKAVTGAASTAPVVDLGGAAETFGSSKFTFDAARMGADIVVDGHTVNVGGTITDFAANLQTALGTANYTVSADTTTSEITVTSKTAGSAAPVVTSQAAKGGVATYTVSAAIASTTVFGVALGATDDTAAEVANALNANGPFSAAYTASVDSNTGKLVISTNAAAGAAHAQANAAGLTGKSTFAATTASIGEATGASVSYTVDTAIGGTTVFGVTLGATDDTAAEVAAALNADNTFGASWTASVDVGGKLVVTTNATGSASTANAQANAAGLTGRAVTAGKDAIASAGTAGATGASSSEIAAAVDEFSVTYDNKTASIKVGAGTEEEMALSINNQLQAAGILDVEASFVDSKLTITAKNNEAKALTITGSSLFGTNPVDSGEAPVSDYNAAQTVDKFVEEVNRSFGGKLRASNDNGKLRIENLSTTDLAVSVDKDGAAGPLTASSSTISGNTARKNLADQFNILRDQLDKLVDDASFNGVNLLRGDNLRLTFNETGTSSINISTVGQKAIDSIYMGLSTLAASDLDSDDNIDTILNTVKAAIGSVQSQASTFGNNLSIVENRTAFTKSMMNTLQTGADSLVLADTNEEAANMLALQTRQQLSSTALSLASQADQAVLRLF